MMLVNHFLASKRKKLPLVYKRSSHIFKTLKNFYKLRLTSSLKNYFKNINTRAKIDLFI